MAAQLTHAPDPGCSETVRYRRSARSRLRDRLWLAVGWAETLAARARGPHREQREPAVVADPEREAAYAALLERDRAALGR